MLSRGYLNAVCGLLDAARETGDQILHSLRSGADIPRAYKPRRHELRVGVDRLAI